MKKAMWPILLVILLALTACSPKEDEMESKGDVKNEETNGAVEVTLPSVLFEGVDMDGILEESNEKGILDVRVNEDASVTYKMTKEKHKKELEEARNDAVNFADMLKGADFPDIQDLKYDESLSEFSVLVDKSAYGDDFDRNAVMGLGMAGILYQSYDGGKHNVTINIVDRSSGDVLDTVHYPQEP